MKKYILFVVTSLLLFSCKTRQSAIPQNAADSVSVQMPKEAGKKINAGVAFFAKVLPPVQFDQIKISSKINLESASSFLPTLDATVYIQKDEKIWMNISALFLNVARGIATQEGIKAINKADKTYIDSDFAYLNQLLNANFINYKSLEKLLMGRTFIKINDREFQLSANNSGYKMTSIVNQKMENEGVTREYKVLLSYAKNYDLKSIYLKDVGSNDELEVSYDSWEDFANYRMPKKVKISIKGSKNSLISIENTKFDNKETKTPFSIPENYTKVEIK